MSKDLNMNRYLDFYESLLTTKQQDVLNLYYREDYSLGEIAEELDISRSAVNDLIKRVDKTLLKYEDKLKLVYKYEKREELYKQLNKDNIDEIISELQELE